MAGTFASAWICAGVSEIWTALMMSSIFLIWPYGPSNFRSSFVGGFLNLTMTSMAGPDAGRSRANLEFAERLAQRIEARSSSFFIRVNLPVSRDEIARYGGK